jgi:uncharacterized membrane protein
MERLIKKLNQKADWLLIGWLILIFALYCILSIVRHNNFQSGGFDLGLFDQEVWKYSRFLFPYNTIKDRLILGDHLNLTTPLLGPLFYIWNDVRALLIFQAFWLTFSSWAIYKIAKIRKFTPLTAFCLAFIYSLFYGIQQAVFFDFHSVIIGVGLLPWLAYFLETDRKKLTILTAVLLVMTQENMGIALAGLGLVYIFNKKYRLKAIIFIISGIISSFVAMKVIGMLSPTGFDYQPQISLNPVNNIVNLFNAGEKQQVWLFSFSWFSFLPLISPGATLAVVLDLAQYFVTGDAFNRMWSPFMHHRAILAPFLALGTMEALSRLKRLKINPQTVALVMVLVTLGIQYGFHFPINKLSKAVYWKNESWMDDDRALFSEIPADASLAAQQDLIPHLSHRSEIYLLWPRKHDFSSNICGQRSCWWLDFGGKPKYMVVDLHPNQWITQLLESNENFESAVNNMEKAGKIILEKQVNDTRLYKISGN